MDPRFTNVDPDHLDRRIEAASQQLTLYPEVADPRNFEPFLQRARDRYARGAPIAHVVNDLRCAGICRKGQARVLRYKVEPHRLRTRRLDPMELALHHADPEFVEQMGRDYGLPLMTVYAGAADPDLDAEVRPMSSYFRNQTLTEPADVVGLAAASYASALGSLMAGDEHEAAGVLRILSGAMLALEDEPPAAGKRYLLLCAALADLLGKRRDELAGHLAGLVDYAVSDPDRAPELSNSGLVGLACLMNCTVSLAPLKERSNDLASLAEEVQRAWELVE